MGRDVGRDEGREQAEWRDLVARLELQAPVDPAEAPWPDRENLRARSQPSTPAGSGAAGKDTIRKDTTAQQAAEEAADGPTGPAPDGATAPAPDGATAAASDDPSGPGDPSTDAPGQPEGTGRLDATAVEDADPANGTHDQRGSSDRSRVIRPAGSTRLSGPDGEPSADASPKTGSSAEQEQVVGPRDYELDEMRDEDLDELWDDRYVPPPLPPAPRLDPVAKGAWLALFGGPGYLLVATLLNWDIPGWAALASVIGFITGFVVLVFRLGDGPSKRDGPDQGAVV